MKSAVNLLILVCLFVGSSQACFDTYLLLQKGSTALSQGRLVVEGSGEYNVIGPFMQKQTLFTGDINLMYGFTDHFTFQFGAGSAEKPTPAFSIDQYAVRGTYNLFSTPGNTYSFDVVLEHHGSFDISESGIELSTPNIYHFNNVSLIAHPALAFSTSSSASLRGHGGIFYRFGSSAIVGLGAEFNSAQSAGSLGRRLVESERATSLFLGSQIGQGVFFQNEFIKGWGGNTKDYGYAATIKLLW